MLVPSDYVGYAAVVTVMGAFYAIVYMIGQALENQKLLAVAKAEMQEVLIGGFMVMLLAYIAFNMAQQLGFYTIKYFIPNSNYATYMTNTDTPSTTGSDDTFFFTRAKNLQDSIVNGYTTIFISGSTLAGNAATASMAYISRGIEGSAEIGGSSWSSEADTGKTDKGHGSAGGSGTLVTYLCKPVAIIASMVNEIVSFVSRSITIMLAQRMLVSYAQYLYLPFFMTGIVLRSFNMVRGIGAFFIGFSIALFVYPIFLILTEGYTIEYFKGMGLNMLDQGSVGALNDNINATAHFTPYGGTIFEKRIDTYCNENPKDDLQSDVDSYQAQLDDGVTMASGNNATTAGSLMFAMLLSQGFCLLMVVSLTGGITKVMGADISPFVIGQITRIGAV
jgi:hypothetical protein